MPMSIHTKFKRENTFRFRNTAPYINTVHLTFAAKNWFPIINRPYLLNRLAELPDILRAGPWNNCLRWCGRLFRYSDPMRRYRIFFEFFWCIHAQKRSFAHNSWPVGPIGSRFCTDTSKNTIYLRKKFQPPTLSHRGVMRHLFLCAFILVICE